MLVNYKNSNIITCSVGEGKPKFVLVPGLNVVEDSIWSDAEKSLADHIKKGLIVPIYKVTKSKGKGKDGKEVEEETKSPVTPDEIPNDQLDAVVDSIQSEAQADKFVESSTKESVRAKGMNRKNKIKEETAKMENKD